MGYLLMLGKPGPLLEMLAVDGVEAVGEREVAAGQEHTAHPSGTGPGSFPRARVVVASARTPPEFSGAGFAAYKYAIRLHARGELAFLLTRTKEDVLLPGRSLSNHSGYRLPEDKVLRTMVKHPLLAIRQRGSVAGAAVYLWDISRLLVGTLGALVSRRDEYDIVHCFSPTWMTGYAITLAKLLGKKVVLEVTLLGSDDPVTKNGTDPLGIRWRFKRLQYRLADAISTISPALFDVCIECGYPRDKVTLIPRSVDVRRFAPVPPAEKALLRQSRQLPTTGPLLLYVGGLNHRKGSDLLMPIFARIRQRCSDAVLVLLGPNAGPEGSVLARQIRESASLISAERQVRFVDPTTAVSEYMQAADLFLFPSRREGFGTVVVEAMACGVPVVARGIPGITSYIIDSGRDGVIVPDDDPEAFASACVDLLTDKEKYRAMASAARDKAMTFSDESIDATYAELYARLMKSNP